MEQGWHIHASNISFTLINAIKNRAETAQKTYHFCSKIVVNPVLSHLTFLNAANRPFSVGNHLRN
jgi:hypothetical protein